jgi:hypothetical protein
MSVIGTFILAFVLAIQRRKARSDVGGSKFKRSLQIANATKNKMVSPHLLIETFANLA